VIGDQDGVLVVKRASKDETYKPYKYLGCDLCHVFYSSRRFYRHNCPNATQDKKISYKRAKEIMDITMEGSKGVAAVLARLKDDELGKIIRHDKVLMDYLKYKTDGKVWEIVDGWVRSFKPRLRLLAEVLRELRKQKPDASWKEILENRDFMGSHTMDALATAIDSCSISEDDSGKQRITPGKKLKMHSAIAHILRAYKAQMIREENETGKKRIEDFEKLMEIECKTRVTDHAHAVMKERNAQAKIKIPTTEDIKKFADFTRKKLDEAHTKFNEEKTQDAYANLQKALMVKLIVLNRRRGRDVASLRVDHVKNSEEQKKSASDDVNSSLTARQKHVAKDMGLICVIGKAQVNNYILLPPYAQAALDAILKNRPIGEIAPDHKYVFAQRNNDKYIEHGRPLKKAIDECGVKNMETRNMRKHLATAFRVSYCSFGTVEAVNLCQVLNAILSL